jgi:hypothetical protein
MSQTDGRPAQRPWAPQPDSPQPVPYEIPVEGSLGLLAVGYRGLLAWREKRDAAAKSAASPDDHA